MRRVALTALLLPIMGCPMQEPLRAPGGEDPELDAPPPTRSAELLAQSDDDGRFLVPFEIGADQTDLHIDVVTSGAIGGIAITRLIAPDGDAVFDRATVDPARLGTTSVFPAPRWFGFRHPITGRAQEEVLPSGTWQLVLNLWQPDGSPSREYNVLASVRVSTKADDDLTSGRLNVRLFYLDGVDDDGAVAQAIETAVARWTEIFGAVGLKLDVRHATTDAPFAAPGNDNAALQQLSADAEPYEVTVLIGDRLSGDLLGTSGGIPGPFVATGSSGVAVETLVHAGVDGELDELEALWTGETMAHEVGHFLGLRHPVELSLDSWDPLNDTPECTDPESCEEQLEDNMMFPLSNPETRRGALTPQQANVLHTSLGAL